ncbi:MAG: hypothetical protein QHI38_07020 [Armatimonadota bacterium]|nr:hypothetical protein [Armatimonadota bacterium]
MRTVRESALKCLRCGVGLDYAGTKFFREGTNCGWLGFLRELFGRNEAFDVYYRPLCGKVEFFLHNVTEESGSQ